MAESLGDGRVKNRDDMETKEAVGTSSVDIASIEDGGIPECAVCLQTCVHPCRLPCGHIFCFLCIKGTVATTHPGSVRRCAMCRREIPPDFLDKPTLLRPILPAVSANPSICGIRESSNSLNSELSDDQRSNDREGYLWFYEGRNGWWQYDERTSLELEVAYKRGERSCELLIAGFLYIADFDAMLQLRRGDPSKRRRIKRDLASIPIKGVAGLRQKVPPLLHDADDNGQANQSPACSMHQAPVTDDRGIFLQTSWYQDEHLTQIPPTPVNTPGNTSPGNASTPSAGSASVVAGDSNTELSLRHTMEEMGRLHLGECTRVSSATSGQRDEGESCADDRLSGRENTRTASVLWSPVSPDIASASPWVLTLSSDEDQL